MTLLELKKRFSFRLSAPSYIFPADYAANAAALAPFLDEIELLFFESACDSLPSLREIEKLRKLQDAMDIRYNIHLPLDIDLCAKQPSQQRKAVQAIDAIFNRVHQLDVTTYTLHLPFKKNDTASSAQIQRWQDQAGMGLAKLMEQLKFTPRQISVETLDYPPEWFAPLVTAFDLSVCVDVGHVIRYGFELSSVFKHFGSRITILHLHGVRNGKDHLALSCLEADHLEIIKNHLVDFTQSVSLEVFSLPRLKESMQTLATLMHHIN